MQKEIWLFNWKTYCWNVKFESDDIIEPFASNQINDLTHANWDLLSKIRLEFFQIGLLESHHFRVDGSIEI